MKDQEKNNTTTVKNPETAQQIYRVRVYKDFDFPSFSISNRNRLGDLIANSVEETREAIIRGENLNCEVLNVLPFSLNASKELEELERKLPTDFNFFIREVALKETEAVHGELDFEKNPKLFFKVQDDKLSVRFALKPEIEAFFIEKIQYLSKIMENKYPQY